MREGIQAEKLAFIGAGYVGLVSGTCFAELGNRVVCVDRDADKIGLLRDSVIPIYEPGLEELVRCNQAAGRLSFTTSIGDAVREADIVFLAVGTPPLEGGDVDLSQVRDAARQIAENIDADKIVVIKSTVPVGTGRSIERLINEHSRSGAKVRVVSNPEFLREGSAIHDTFHPDRIVIGCEDPEAGERIRRLHEPLGAETLITGRESAELIKYAANAFLATKISFINEMANICEKVGADIGMVAKGIGLDKRIGPHFLQAGVGYGGSCFPKDTRAQLRIAEDVDYEFRILRAVIEVNRLQRLRFAQKIERAAGPVEGKRIAVLGLAFKPETDDLRDAPSLDVADWLIRRGADVIGYDPVAWARAAQQIPELAVTDSLEAALRGADAVVVVTQWESIRRMDLDWAKSLVARPIMIDGRNIWEPAEMAAKGWTYWSVGRPE
ncbi:UDP-glucose dehydrogenase family protein [Paenibacillus thermoaerophilus]|uniref:UDP-glucose 6-dehydrogenase n=1 Tax=Paenibacillus thermoaerophilus TaxID=1215385 RepID=A0ABW2UZS2_9BACL|nr:UDP-glucose/GDP-mannose dehydrogenase family protein [Paenibacillus thermoaerophilus]TMV19140.1 UDP-glucose/GDP-mannose dehydrogenase family protein [Paenibacillus thermoaerophilus]